MAAWTSGRCSSPSPPPPAASRGSPPRLRPASSPSTCSRWATTTSRASRSRSAAPPSRKPRRARRAEAPAGEPFAQRRAALEQALASAAPPIHVTPLTRDETIARAWFDRFEGAGLDGLIAKRPDLTYEPDKRVMSKIKHVRTADCVVAGYRVHKTALDAIGSLLLGLYVDETAPASQWNDRVSGLAPVGVVGAFPMARRRELFAELQPLVIDVAAHPWSWAAEMRQGPEGGCRWNPKKDLSFVPLAPERVVEVRYDYLEGARFRHPPQFVRWRPDRDPASCGFAQLDQPAPFDVTDVLAGRVPQ